MDAELISVFLAISSGKDATQEEGDVFGKKWLLTCFEGTILLLKARMVIFNWRTRLRIWKDDV